MKTQKLLSSEITPLRVSSLPTRPTAPASMGGKGYTPAQMKAAFDKLPLLIAERFNSLIDDITTGCVLEAIEVAVGDGMKLSELIEAIGNGNLASLLSVGNSSLAVALANLETRLARLEEVL